MKRMAIFVCLSVLCLCACAGQDDTFSLKKVVDGVEIIENGEIGAWKEAGAFELTEEAQFGAFGRGDDLTSLHSIFDVDVDSAGNVYVCDYAANRITIFNRDGSFRICIAHRAERSDSLRGPVFARVNREGRVAVYEAKRDEISIFSDLGEFETSFPPDCGSVQSIEFDDSSRIYLTGLNLALENSTNSEDGVPKCVRVYESSGRTLHQFGKPYLLGRQRNVVNPYSTTFLTLLHDGTLLCALHYPYILRMYSATGALKKVITKPCAESTRVVRIPFLPFESYMILTQVNLIAVYELADDKFLVHYIDRDSAYADDFQTSLMNRLTAMRTEQPDSTIRHYYDIFDRAGHFLCPLRSDALAGGVLKYADRGGHIYVQYYDADIRRYQLRRYAIAIRNESRSLVAK